MSKGHYTNMPKIETVWEENDSGLLIAKEQKFEPREKMCRWEWKVLFSQEEISREEYLAECKEFNHLPHGHM